MRLSLEGVYGTIVRSGVADKFLDGVMVEIRQLLESKGCVISNPSATFDDRLATRTFDFHLSPGCLNDGI